MILNSYHYINQTPEYHCRRLSRQIDGGAIIPNVQNLIYSSGELPIGYIFHICSLLVINTRVSEEGKKKRICMDTEYMRRGYNSTALKFDIECNKDGKNPQK